MRFFFDNNLPPKLAKSLHVLVEPHHQVVHLKAKFAANATDEAWMLDLAKEQNWVIVSGDLRIRKNPHEIAAWRSAGHTTFTSLSAGSRSGIFPAKPEPPCKSGQLKKDLGLEMSSARHAARLEISEVMKFLFVGFK